MKKILSLVCVVAVVFAVASVANAEIINVALGSRGTDSRTVTRYGANGNNMNGTASGPTVAPLSYSGATWNNDGGSDSGSNLLDSDGNVTPVGFSQFGYKTVVGDWFDVPGVLKLSDGAALHADPGWGGGYAVDNGVIPGIKLTGLDTGMAYNVAIVLPGRDARTVKFNVGGAVEGVADSGSNDPNTTKWTVSGGTSITAINPANLSTFVENQNYVLFNGLTPNQAGEISVYAERISGGDWALAGFQVQSVPEPSTFALLGMGAIGLLGWAWRRRRV